MPQPYDAPPDAGMLSSRHPCRSDVLLYHLERAIAQTPLKEQHFAVALAEAYEDCVDPHARTINLCAPCSSKADEWADERNAVTERLRRYRSHRQPIPAELEEAWVHALPEPFASSARRTLARRYGYMAAARPDGPLAVADVEMIPSACRTTGDVIKSLGDMFDDGRIDADDRANIPQVLERIDNAMATLAAIRAKAIAATGYEEPTLALVRE